MAFLTNTDSAFNPGVAPTAAPDYLRLSRPIEQPSADTSTAEALKGAGDVFSSAVKVAHTITEEELKDETRKRLTGIRSEYTSDIDNVYNTLTGTKVSDDALNILSTSPQVRMPQAIADAPKTLGAIEAARPGGRYSQSHLDALYDTALKDLRSKYPGWVPQIDKWSSEITGRDVANDYIKQRIADVNAWAAKAQGEKDKLISKGLQHLDITDMPVHLQAYQNGTESSFEFTSFMNKGLNFKYRVDQQKLELEAMQGEKSIISLKAEGIAQQEASHAFTDGLNTLFIGQEKDPTKLIEGLTKNIDGPKALLLAQSWEQNRLKIEAELRAKWSIPDATGKTTFDRLTTKRANEMIDENSQLHKFVIGYLKDQQIGPIVIAKKMADAMQDESSLRLLQHKTIGPILQDIHTIEQKAGASGLAVVMPSLLVSDLANEWGHYTSERKVGATAGSPDPSTGLPRTLTNDTKDLQSKKTTPALQARIADKFIEQAELIDKPGVSDELKKIAIKYVYNQGLIDLIQPDTANKAGKNSLYSKLLEQNKLAEAKRLGGESWAITSNWAKDTFGNELLKPALLSMKDFNLESLSPKLSFAWNDKTNNFSVVNQRGEDVLLKPNPGRPTQDSLSPYTQRTLNNINQNLNRLSAIAKIEGTDVSEFLFQQMKQLGFDPTLEGAPKNIPEHMISAMRASKLKMEEEAAKAKATKAGYGFSR